MPSPKTDDGVLPFVAKPTPAYVSITPDTARHWLASNHVNRKLRQFKVAQYARDIEAGRWTLNADAICFSPDGMLLNGQHRLNAIIRSGRTVVMLVLRGVPPEAMKNMDNGSARTAADVLAFDGETTSALLASTAKQAALLLDGRIYRDNVVQAVSHAEIVEFVADHPEIRESVKVAGSIRHHVDAPPTALAVAHWRIALRVGSELADHYLHQLATKSNEPEGSAVLAVDSRLAQLRRTHSKFATRNYIYLLVKGWNHYAAGTLVTSLAIAPAKGKEFRIPEPSRWTRTA